MCVCRGLCGQRLVLGGGDALIDGLQGATVWMGMKVWVCGVGVVWAWCGRGRGRGGGGGK